MKNSAKEPAKETKASEVISKARTTTTPKPVVREGVVSPTASNMINALGKAF